MNKRIEFRMIMVKGCHNCPYCDGVCTETNRDVDRYEDNESFPPFCPLEKECLLSESVETETDKEIRKMVKMMEEDTGYC